MPGNLAFLNLTQRALIAARLIGFGREVIEADNNATRRRYLVSNMSLSRRFCRRHPQDIVRIFCVSKLGGRPNRPLLPVSQHLRSAHRSLETIRPAVNCSIFRREGRQALVCYLEQAISWVSYRRILKMN